jgi:hypothetical protein
LQKVASQSYHDLEVLRKGGSITRKRKQKYVWLDKRIQNCSKLLVDGELTNLEFLEVAHNFTYNPERDALQDEDKENESDESAEPTRKKRRVETPKDSDSDSD